jgi:hypothetical protein
LNSIFAFDLLKFKNETGISQDEIEEMLLLIKKEDDELLDLPKLILALSVAAKFADPQEIHALTGYDWDEVQNLIQDLKNI